MVKLFAFVKPSDFVKLAAFVSLLTFYLSIKPLTDELLNRLLTNKRTAMTDILLIQIKPLMLWACVAQSR
ncbi:hypothetical protein A8M58_01190 [Yersinia pestis]|nr:hypothetical protein A8M58_01190 [Yersinia pestis]